VTPARPAARLWSACRSEQALRVGLVASFVAYLLFIVCGSEQLQGGWASHVLFDLPYALSSFAASRARRRGGAAGVAWLALAAALALYLAGSVYTIAFIDGDVYPSPADGLWLLSYGFAVLALVLLARATIAGVTRTALLDGFIAGTAAAATATTLVVGPLLDTGSGRPSVVATNLAYPIADLLLLGLLVTTSKLVARIDRVRLLLGLGVAALFAGDCTFLWNTAHGYVIPDASAAYLLFVGSACLLGLAATFARPAEPVAAAAPHLAVPAIGAAACVAMLALAQVLRPGPAAIGLDVVLAILVGIRVSSGIRDLRSRVSRQDECPTLLARLEEVRLALGERQIVAHFQPQVDLQTGQVVGAEVLARWEHPVRGLLGPPEFLPLLVEADLMGRLTRSMLQEATEARDACAAVGHPLGLSLNLSTPELADPALLIAVTEVAARWPASGGALTLEITEESVISDPENARLVLAKLRQQGVRISVDDYGTGHASLAYLRDLPLDEVKLDRSFVRGAWVDERSAAIAASTVELAHHLKLDMVAEGIEDPETDDWLRSIGCDIGQGYFHARPMALDDLVAWLDARAVAAHEPC